MAVLCSTERFRDPKDQNKFRFTIAPWVPMKLYGDKHQEFKMKLDVMAYEGLLYYQYDLLS